MSCVANLKVREKLDVTDSRFWGLYSHDGRAREAARALAARWEEVKDSLPVEIFGDDDFCEFIGLFDEVRESYKDVGAADTEGREAIYLLCSRHYKLSPSVFSNLWVMGTMPF